MKNNEFNAVVSFVEMENPIKDGKLSGWDVALKDNINMKGTLTTASSHMLSNYKSIYNATVVEKLLDAGVNVVAKASMDELGMGGYNLTAHTGPVLNPHNKAYSAGGSSGGSAALVASGLVRMALGTDTGDSVRKPASYTGVVGFKPSYGLISRYGVIPYAGSLDHVGIFTQTVKDAAISLEVLAGKDPHDMTTLDKDAVAYSNLLNIDLEGKRIGIFKNVVDVIEDENVLDVFNNLLSKLESKGAILVEKSLDQDLARTLFPTYSVISNAEAITHHANLDGLRFGLSKEGETLEEVMIHSRSEGFGLQVKERFIYGAYALENDNQFTIYDQARKVRQLLVDAYTAFYDDVDVMIVPASPSTAPRLDADAKDSKTDLFLIAENHMVINNFSGYPSITVPMGLIDNMPIGVNISAFKQEDAKLLGFAKQFETILEGEHA